MIRRLNLLAVNGDAALADPACEPRCASRGRPLKARGPTSCSSCVLQAHLIILKRARMRPEFFRRARDAAVVRAIVAGDRKRTGRAGAGVGIRFRSQPQRRDLCRRRRRPSLKAAVRGAGKAAELIDLNRAPRRAPARGRADVIPFIPLEGSTMDDAVAAAHRAGAEIWSRFGVPVYFYEAAARLPERKRLEKVRRQGFDGLPPDVGTIASHPSAGASVVGARGFLIAYNVDLETPDPRSGHGDRRDDPRIVRRLSLCQSDGTVSALTQLRAGFDEPGEFCKNAARLIYSAPSQRRRRDWARAWLRRTDRIHSSRAPSRWRPSFSGGPANFDESRIIENRVDIATLELSAGHH